MEVCTKLPISECGDADWVVNPLPTTGVTAAAAVTATSATYTTPTYTEADGGLSPFKAGSTVDPPIAALQRFPRRVAYSRATTPPQLDSASTPKPLGITFNGGTNLIAAADDSNLPAVNPNRNSLWFATGASPNVTYDGTTIPYQLNTENTPNDGRDASNTWLPKLAVGPLLPPTVASTPPYEPTEYKGTQPLLLPVLQLQNVSTATSGDQTGSLTALQTGWIPQARETTFNLIIGANDTPSRILTDGNTSDFNGGLQNLPRFLESWGENGAITTNIRGSFIQLSAAPLVPHLINQFRLKG